MPSSKELKKKIRSISNTKKITRTMELVATAKSKRTQDRIRATSPYSNALAKLLEDLGQSGSVSHPFLGRPEKVERSVVFVVTANRGLCGGYNSNVLALAEKTIREEKSEGRQVDVYMAGRKGISRFRFLGIPVQERLLNLDDRATFSDVETVAEGIMARFLAAEVGRVLIVSTRYYSAGVQRPALMELLPITAPGADGPRSGGAGRKDGGGQGAAHSGGAALEFLFEPDPQTILDSLLPLSVKTVLFRIIVEASASEQIARRMAMKLATDNAEEMIRFYNRMYNRSRQAGITRQINEIVSGANALE